MPDLNDDPRARHPSNDERARRLAELTSELGEPMTLDALTRDFVIYQRRRGHRHSTDDLLTAYYAVVHAPSRVERSLDLGTGIGSVGQAVAWHFPNAALTAIEVQDISFRLLRENLWANGLEARVRAIHGDLRHALPDERFDLVTGSPPYFDISAGIVSADPQRAGARFELRGDVRDYCAAAKRTLAPDGRFVFCFPTAQRDRAERAVTSAGLALTASRDVIPRQGLAPLFSLFACAHAADTPPRDPPFLVRDAQGAHTPSLKKARSLFGLDRLP